MAKTTELAIGRLVAELSSEHPAATLAIRKPPFEKLPASVAAVHASHRLLSSAVEHKDSVSGASHLDGVPVRLRACVPSAPPAQMVPGSDRARNA